MIAFAMPLLKSSDNNSDDSKITESRHDGIILSIEMINSAGPSFLAAFSLILFSNIDEETFNLVLNTFQQFVIVVGLLGLVPLRDALLASLCKLSVPTGTSLSLDLGVICKEITDFNLELSPFNGHKQQVGSLNERNVTALKCLLKICDNLQSVLENKLWFGIIDTFQIVDNLISTGKVEKKSSSGINSSENLYSQLNLQIKTLFTKSSAMNMKDLSEFVRALCQLSQEIAIGASLNQAVSANSNRDTMKVAEEKSFAISKLLDVSLSNLNRLLNASISEEVHTEVSSPLPIVDIWEMIIGQLIEVSHTPASSVSIRSQACAAFGEILISAIQIADFTNPQIESRIINPIKSLILVEALSPVTDNSDERIVRYLWLLEVQKSALDSLYRILQAGGQKINECWITIFEIFQGVLQSCSKKKRLKVGDLNGNDNTSISDQVSGKIIPLVRLSFPSIQLICSDFLSILRLKELSKCIETVYYFGTQKEDFNISLSSIRLLWSISDYILAKKVELEKADKIDENSFLGDESQADAAGSLESLWMLLLSHLSQLCSDERPEVRNSANQSLFGSINMNGKKLSLEEWDEFIWNILFPLVERIKEESVASLLLKPQEVLSSPVHHARNTPSKQWDETKVLLLNGISKIFVDYMHVLVRIPSGFEKAWTKFLEYIQESCIQGSIEVSMAAAKSLKFLMQYPKAFSDVKPMPDIVNEHLISLWLTGWRFFHSIGFGIILCCVQYDGKSIQYLQDINFPFGTISQGTRTQEMLVVLLTLASDLYDVVQSEITLKDYHLLFRLITLLLVYHPISSNDPSDRFRTLIISDTDQTSPLQQAIIELQMKISDSVNEIEHGPELFIRFISNNASLPFIKQKPISFLDGKTYTYDAFSKKSFQLLEESISKNIDQNSIYTSGAFKAAMEGFHLPLLRKYDIDYFVKDQPPIWRYAVQSFINVTKQALDSLNSKLEELSSENLNSIYSKIISNFEVFLLSKRYLSFFIIIQ